MLFFERFPFSTSQWLSIALLSSGTVAFTANVGEAQLRTGRGTRDLYNANARKVVQAESEVELASASQEIDQPTPTTIRPSNSNRVPQQKRMTSTPSAPRAKFASQDLGVVQAGCTSCGTGGVGSDQVMGIIEGNEVGCDSCGTGCDAGPMVTGGPIVVDLGCGPLAQIVGWISRRSYIRFDAANFSQNGVDLPILATTGTNLIDGFRPNAPILFGGNEVHGDSRIGYRFQVGLWLDPCQERALEVRGYDAGSWSTHLQADASTIGANQVLARPVFATNTGTQDRVLLVAADRSVTGSFIADMTTQSYGGDILLRRRLGQDCNVRWDMLIGYQGNRVNDNLSINSESNDGQSIDELRDSIVTRNQFDGMALGLSRFSRWCNWSLDARYKMGFGNMRREVVIEGSETINRTFVRPAGLLARATNSDTFIEDTFVVSPELSLDLGYALTPNLDFTIGYNYLSLPKVARAGSQIDQQADRVPRTDVSSTSSGPRFNLTEQNYWLQSFNFGAQWRY